MAAREDPSYVAVLRAGAPAFDVDSFLGRNGSLEPDAVWRRGEPGITGKVSETSGLNLSIAEASTSQQLFERSMQSLVEQKDVLAALRKEGTLPTLDVAMMVQVGRDLSMKLKVPLEMLRLLSGMEIELVVSTYLSSD